MRPGVCVPTAPLWRAASAVFLIYPFGQGSFSDGMPSPPAPSTSMLVSKRAPHPDAPFQHCWVWLVFFGGSLFRPMHGSLVHSSLACVDDRKREPNYGLPVRQEEETYKHRAAHGYFGSGLIFQYASFNKQPQPCTSGSHLAGCGHCHRPWRSTMASTQRFQLIVDPRWAKAAYDQHLGLTC